jgi:LPS O-antigen subunit length determinant protein (WzzB/FepE family)
LGTTAIAALLGAGAYFLSPNVYQSDAVIYPITQSDFAEYTDLVARSALASTQDPANPEEPPVASAFPYTRDSLFQEFTAYLQSPDHLIRAAQESGVTKDNEGSALTFVRTVRFTQPTEKAPWLEMRARAGNQEALNRFIASSLDNARIEVGKKIQAATLNKIEAGKKVRADAIRKLEAEINSRRSQQEDARKDQIARLKEQAKIAETLGIKDPITVQSVNVRNDPAPTASAQVISGDQPLYFQGSTALEEQIDLLSKRSDNDPFISELRDLERQVFVLKNNRDSQRLTELLNESPLGNPATAPLAEYSVTGASAEKVSPKAGIFAAGSLFLGLMLGSLIVLFRQDPKQA